MNPFMHPPKSVVDFFENLHRVNYVRHILAKKQKLTSSTSLKQPKLTEAQYISCGIFYPGDDDTYITRSLPIIHKHIKQPKVRFFLQTPE